MEKYFNFLKNWKKSHPGVFMNWLEGNSCSLIWGHFLPALNTYLGGSLILKHLISEFYWNLLMQALSKENQDVTLSFKNMTELVNSQELKLKNYFITKEKNNFLS